MKKIIAKIRGSAKSDFVKVSSWSAISTVVKMISGILSTKIAAKFIGPDGIAAVGNFMNGINLLSVVGTGGIGQGVTKYIAEHYDDEKKQYRIISESARVTFISTLIVSILVVVFSAPIAKSLFKSDKYQDIIILFGLSLILYTFNTLLLAILNGFKEYKKFVKVNIIGSLTALLVSVFLIVNFGLYGALINVVISQAILILITIQFVSKAPWFKGLFKRVPIEWTVVKMLFGFAMMTLVATITMQSSQLAIRSYIGSSLSQTSAGIWEAMNRISSMYLLVITTGISTYYLPRLSEIKQNYILKVEIFKTAKVVLPMLLLSCFIIFIARDLILWLLFTPAFSEARNLFIWQMIGDFFKIASWLIAFLLWAKAMVKEFIIIEILFNIFYVFSAKFFINIYGLEGSVVAYALSYIVYTIVIIILFRKLLFNRSLTKLY